MAQVLTLLAHQAYEQTGLSHGAESAPANDKECKGQAVLSNQLTVGISCSLTNATLICILSRHSFASLPQFSEGKTI